jgi:hypothetical protein
MSTKRYQGWTNYSTWAVALWIDNDEGLYRERLALVREETTAASRGHVRAAVGERLRTWVEEMAPDLGATLWSDLLTAAIGDVDWSELAGHWIDEQTENDEHARGEV